MTRPLCNVTITHAIPRLPPFALPGISQVVPIGGEHIQAIDEPYIAKVGAHMSEAINRIEAEEKQAK